MLILSRYLNEKVFIDVPPSDVPRRIVVEVLQHHGLQTRLGFVADPEVRINRAGREPLAPGGEDRRADGDADAPA